MKMTISTISLLMLIVCFAIAAPIVQQEKTTNSNEKTNHITPPAKPNKKLNFIQKFILKKAKMTPDEKRHRKMAVWSVIIGISAFPLCLVMLYGHSYAPAYIAWLTGAIAMYSWLISLVLLLFVARIGLKVIKNTKSKKTRKIAIAGLIAGVVSLIAMIVFIANIWINADFA